MGAIGGKGMDQAAKRTKAELVAAALDWVEREGVKTPHFCGAFLHGSILEREDQSILSPSSDVDLVVVLDAPNPPVKPGKLRHGGALLDVTSMSRSALQSPQSVLGNYHLAPSLARPGILADPSGDLSRLHAVVAREYARPDWIWRRTLHARDNVLDKLRALEQPAPLYDHVLAWLFAAGVLCHIALVAALQNPTVRKRYVAARTLLAAHGREDVYRRLLQLLGSSKMTPSQAARHLDRMAEAFDIAKGVVRTPYFFATDISDLARPISVDGNREMIERGDHQEAIFWIVATYCRSLKILATDAPGEWFEACSHGFIELLAELGIESEEDLRRRAVEVRAAIATTLEVAGEIIKGNS